MIDTDSLLEELEIVLGKSIGLGNDRDQVHESSKTFHDLDIERLKTEELMVDLDEKKQTPKRSKAHV